MEEEIWKVYKVYKINGKDFKKGDKLYFSNLGRCKLNDTIVESIANEKGYLRARSIFVHIAVATLFVPNANNKPCVDHIDCNKLNNRADNLRWVTFSENNLNPITRKRMSIAKTNISEEEKERQFLSLEYYYKNLK